MRLKFCTPEITPQHVQLSLLVLGFLWGVYTFAWQNYLARLFEDPKVNITPEISNVTGGQNMIRLSINVSNPNQRKIFIGDSRWALYELKRSSGGDTADFKKRLRKFNQSPINHIEKTSVVRRGELLGVGSLFRNSDFPSGYKRSTVHLVDLPPGVKELNLQIIFPHSFEDISSKKHNLFQYRITDAGELTAFTCNDPRNHRTKAPDKPCSSWSPAQPEELVKRNVYYLEFDESFVLKATNELTN
jgi:hypothetical protein